MILRKDKPTGSSVPLTDRDRRLLSLLSECRILSRAQIARACGFSSVTRTNARLAKLSRACILARSFHPTATGSRQAVYRLGKYGGESDSKPRQPSSLFVDHQLAVNDVRLSFQLLQAPGFTFGRWLTETHLRTLNLGCVPDGYVEYAIHGLHFAAFVEVDRNTEALTRLEQKARAYVELAFGGQFQHLFTRKFFRVFVVAPTATRVDAIARAMTAITSQLFWIGEYTSVCQAPLGAVWRRPAHSIPQSLILNPP